ncbi:subtilisin-like protein [Dendrothele bispora CBS 962.96]|uniref:Subtilisin-like protein n=1 Tax=Dendrothele bispora (strain CBS 962.96) TaxID=1314807 RepID=A0A4S8LBM9_DENBC|nr:subtilisin-like protein [Dendrothele bispora CBS 962.96]
MEERVPEWMAREIRLSTPRIWGVDGRPPPQAWQVRGLCHTTGDTGKLEASDPNRTTPLVAMMIGNQGLDKQDPIGGQPEKPPTNVGSGDVSSTSSRPSFVNLTYRYDKKQQGKSVDVYVFDSGIKQIPEFEARLQESVINGFKDSRISEVQKDELKFLDNAQKNDDFKGHGTHVASVLAGKEYGVAKKATLFSVKVLDEKSKGNPISISHGIKEVLNKVRASNPRKQTVINFSIGGVFEDRWVDVTLGFAELIKEGVHVVASAGNAITTAGRLCTPTADVLAKVPGIEKKLDFLNSNGKLDEKIKQILDFLQDIIIVGATDIQDKLATITACGPRVDILAPGQNVYGYPIAGEDKSPAIGTSESCAIVAGLLACHISGIVAQKAEKNISEDEAHKLLVPKECKAALLANAVEAAIISTGKSASTSSADTDLETESEDGDRPELTLGEKDKLRQQSKGFPSLKFYASLTEPTLATRLIATNGIWKVQ